MKITGLHDIRREFLDFFEERGHLIEDSYSLIPQNDKSLLLIGAGMAPIKKYFTGEQTPPRTRMATSQKCMRTGDLENVGITARHATFFEMLGNFSFGDYFKREAIHWAWEFMTEVLEIPKDVLWATIYLDDDEAHDIWHDEIGLAEDRIVRLGKEDNFWELEVGPSGPCTEIHVDRGEEYGCGDPDCKPGCDCDRYLELWNLVFSQYNKDEDGVYHPLENKNIDTGMGLERIAAYMQGADNIFEIEEVKHIIEKIEEISGYTYKTDQTKDMSVRVITDHIRASVFMISDTIIPSNEGRGYVLRRLIRRAARHGRRLGIEGDFLYKLADSVIEEWGVAYPELIENRDRIKNVIRQEEERFSQTLDQGMLILEEYIEELKKDGKDTLDGHHAFKLYDTYGFPMELTREILSERSLKVDEAGFEKEMQEQRDRARMAIDTEGNIGWSAGKDGDIEEDQTVFLGYKSLDSESTITAIYKDGQKLEEIQEKDQAILILDETPFYAEGGGQIGDMGIIEGEGFRFDVQDTQKNSKDVILHIGQLVQGTIKTGDLGHAIVEESRRKAIVRNHTATHLLHAALRKILGEHVTQAGSEVREDGFRFDFTHFEALTDQELAEIENLVNDYIYSEIYADIYYLTLEEAHDSDAICIFEESYGDTVRIVDYPKISKELCGGTHVEKTSDIGIFKILSESGVAAGVRRIEATTGKNVYRYLNKLEDQEEKIEDLLNVNKGNVLDRINALLEENKKLINENESLKRESAREGVDELLDSYSEINGIKVISARIDNQEIDVLRDLADELRDKLESGIIVLGTVNEGKVNFVTTVTDDLIDQGYKAGDIIKDVAKIAGGGGGGRPNMATAGAKEIDKIDDALEAVSGIIENIK